MEKAGGEGDEGGVVFGLVPRVSAGMYDAWVAQLYKHEAIRMTIITTMPVTVAIGGGDQGNPNDDNNKGMARNDSAATRAWPVTIGRQQRHVPYLRLSRLAVATR